MPGHASSPYWTAVDFDSEGDEEPSPSSSQRVYVDPWDSEQYSLGRAEPGDSSQGEQLTSLAGEPVSASFYYVPTKSFESDEEGEEARPGYPQGRRRRGSRPHPADLPDAFNYGYDVMPIQRRISVYNPEEYYVQHLPYESPYHPLPPPLPPPTPGTYLPPPGPRKRVSLPAPHPDYVMATLKTGNHRRPSRYAEACDRYAYESLLWEHGAAEEWARSRAAAAAVPRAAPYNFHLSRYGHLKIDYSCSWTSLDRLIRNQ